MPDSLKSIQSGVYSDTSSFAKNEKDYSQFKYWLTGIDVTQQNLDNFTPYIKGVSRLYMYTVPAFLDKIAPDLTMRFKSYLETGFRSVTGISDLSVDFVDFEGGFAGQKFSNVSIVRDDTESITVSLYEQSGSPVREFLDAWVTGVRDPLSGIAHYHGAIDNGVPYSEKNHTAEFIYINLDPTGRRIEYACMLAYAFPTRVPKEHYNYEFGDRGNAQLDIEFRCKKYESRYINDIAAFYLACDSLKYSYYDFNPNQNLGSDEVKKKVQNAYILK